MTRKEIELVKKIGEVGIMTLRDNSERNFGLIRFEGEKMFLYTGKGLKKECWKSDFEESTLIDEQCIDVIQCSEIKSVV